MPASLDFADYARSRSSALLRLAYLLCGDRHRAEDLVQETLLSAYRRWGRVERADDPDAYVRRMLVNAHLSWRRRLSSTERPVSTVRERAAPGDLSADVVTRDLHGGCWQSCPSGSARFLSCGTTSTSTTSRLRRSCTVRKERSAVSRPGLQRLCGRTPSSGLRSGLGSASSHREKGLPMNVDDGLADLLERTLSDRASHTPSGTEAADRVPMVAPARSRRRRVLTVIGCVASSMAVVAVAVAVLSPEPGPTPAREPVQAVASSGPTNGLAVSASWDRDGLDERGDVRTWVYEGLAIDVPASWRAVGRRCDQPGGGGCSGREACRPECGVTHPSRQPSSTGWYWVAHAHRLPAFGPMTCCVAWLAAGPERHRCTRSATARRTPTACRHPHGRRMHGEGCCPSMAPGTD